jgi:O-antigen ligase
MRTRDATQPERARALVRRPQALDAGLFLIVAAVPLALTPFSWAPFADPKLVLLTLGALLVFLGGLRMERMLAMAAGAWFAAGALATIFGVDPLRSLWGLDTALTGLLFLAPCALLVVAGASLDPERIERLRTWLGWTGAVMAVVLIAWKLFPSAITAAAPNVDFVGSTAGNPVFAAAVMTAGLACVLGRPDEGRTLRSLALVALLSFGISLSAERSAWLLPAIATPVTLAWGRVPWRRSLLLGGVVVAVMAAGVLLEPLLPSGASPSEQITSFESDSQRLTVWRVDARAWLERPTLGWGPVNSWSAYRATATPEETEQTGFGWNEAHNIVIQTATTSGLIGLAAFAVLALVVARRGARAEREHGWVVGGVAMLAAFHLYEPFNIPASSLLFLLAGVAASGETRWLLEAQARALDPERTPGRLLVGAELAAAVCLSVLSLAASSFQLYGERNEDEPALERAIDLQPSRISARAALIEDLALDGRAGSEGATERARELIDETVGMHPWDTQIRLSAADASILLNDLPAAQAWAREQLQRFPGDSGVLPAAGPEDLGETSSPLP